MSRNDATKAIGCWEDIQVAEKLLAQTREKEAAAPTGDFQIGRIYEAAIAHMTRRLQDTVSKLPPSEMMRYTKALQHGLDFQTVRDQVPPNINHESTINWGKQ
jgi:hypothetical protein